MGATFTNRRDLLIELVRTNFKLRYNNSVLGFTWVLLKPLLTFFILYVVWSHFRGDWVENFQMYLLLGIILYNFLNDGIVYGMNGIWGTAHIILKVNFPREIALAASLIMAIINLCVNIIVLIIFSFFNPLSMTIYSVLYFIFIVIIIFIIIYGISFFTSIVLIKLRDLEHITTLIMQLLIYATPIFYPLEIIQEPIRSVLKLNPFTTLIQSARQAIIYGKITYEKEIGIILFVAIILFVCGFIYFKKHVKRIAEKF